MCVKTRWNSVHDMIKRMLLLYDNVNRSLISLGKNEMVLFDDEIDLLSAIQFILTPVSQYTKMLEADLTPTAHFALTLGREVVDTVRDWVPLQEDNYHTFPIELNVRRSVELFRTQLQRNLETRLSIVFDEEFYKICAFLSPRTKELQFLTVAQNQSVKRSLIRMMRAQQTPDNVIISNNQSQQDPIRIRTSLTGRIGSIGRSNMVTTDDPHRQEIERYCNSIVNPQHLLLHSDPLEYWRQVDIRTAFPNLYLLAKEYLHIPMSSAPSERVFSAMERTVTDLRNRLQPETASKLVTLKSNNNLW